MSAAGYPRILPLGEQALLLELGDELSPTVNGRVRAVARGLREVPGVAEAAPALRSVLVLFDPLATDVEPLVDAADRLIHSVQPTSSARGRVIEVPVLYGGEAGPDLSEVAALQGVAPDDVIRVHSATEYTVYMLGFMPGFPYLGILPEMLRTPRLPSPRLRLPAGSVAIADTMTGIYPLPSPGGWRVIGRTPLAVYDPREADPVLLRPGDLVRFVPLPRAKFAESPAVRPLPVPRHPVFEVFAPGLYTTIQDLGRPGHRSLGIPASGAMDPLAMQVANAAVGNPLDAPVLEMTAPGPILRVLDHAVVAVAGADLSPTLDGTALEPGRAATVRPGQTLEVGAPRAGVWSYLAVAGKVEGSTVLGSASTYVPGALGGSAGRRLREGDILGRSTTASGSRRIVPGDAVAIPGAEAIVRVILGPQDEWLTDDARTSFGRGVYRVTVHGDRAGVRLDGPLLTHRVEREFLSDGLLAGAIQVPAGGQPIVIMPDGPATGGYPKMAMVIGADLRLVAQARPGTEMRFRAVSMEEALEALREQRAFLDAISN